MSGTSAATGYLFQNPSSIPTEDQLTDILQTMVVALTGLDTTLVRPRWQPQPPTQPPPTTDWCAIGIMTYRSTDYPGFIQTVSGGSAYRLEELEVLATFYGPNSDTHAANLRDGVYIDQNYRTLAAQGVKLREAGDILRMPEVINSQFISRSDLPLSFMRMISRDYPVETIASAQVSFVTDSGLSCTETIEEN
jgi:hypothetical protein